MAELQKEYLRTSAGRRYFFTAYFLDESAATSLRADVAGGFMSARFPVCPVCCDGSLPKDWWDGAEEAGTKTRPQTVFNHEKPELSVLAVDGGKLALLGSNYFYSDLARL